MGDKYIEPKILAQESYSDYINIISQGLERLKKPTLMNYFGADSTALPINHFSRGASLIDLPLNDPRYPGFLDAFKDEEKLDHINLGKIQSLIDKQRPVVIPISAPPLPVQPTVTETQTISHVAPNEPVPTKSVRFAIQEPDQGTNTSPAAMAPSAQLNLPGK